MDTQTQQRLNDLSKRQTEIIGELNAVKDKLPKLAFEGNETEIAAAKQKIREFEAELETLVAAIDEGQKRLEDEAEVKLAAELEQVKAAVSRVDKGRLKAAKRFDAALEDLEAAWQDYEFKCSEIEHLSRPLQTTGKHRTRDVLNRRTMALRAFWSLSPKLASRLSIAFTPGSKRHGLSEAL